MSHVCILCMQALETARTANRRLTEEVKASREELTSMRGQQREGVERHSQSLIAAKTALDEVISGLCLVRGL